MNKGASTLDMVVAEFRRGSRRMDLASACVLRPLNHLVQDIVVWVMLFNVIFSDFVIAKRNNI